MKGKSWLISLGNSSDGALGACIRITTLAHTTKEQVVKQVQDFLTGTLRAFDGIDLGDGDVTKNAEMLGVEYVRVFFNTQKITVTEIAEGDTEEIDKLES